MFVSFPSTDGKSISNGVAKLHILDLAAVEATLSGSQMQISRCAYVNVDGKNPNLDTVLDTYVAKSNLRNFTRFERKA